MTPPSSPDRIEAVTQAIHRVRCCDRTDEQSVRYYRDYAEIAVAALDAYDREHRAMVLHSAVQAGRADLRERIAQEIEAHAAEPENAPWRAFGAGLRTAARIARGVA